MGCRAHKPPTRHRTHPSRRGGACRHSFPAAHVAARRHCSPYVCHLRCAAGHVQHRPRARQSPLGRPGRAICALRAASQRPFDVLRLVVGPMPCAAHHERPVCHCAHGQHLHCRAQPSHRKPARGVYPALAPACRVRPGEQVSHAHRTVGSRRICRCVSSGSRPHCGPARNRHRGHLECRSPARGDPRGGTRHRGVLPCHHRRCGKDER